MLFTASAASPALAPISSIILSAAQTLLHPLARGVAIDARALREAMTAASGGSDAEGAWDWKSSYEACEVAQLLFLRRFGSAIAKRPAAAQLAMIAKVAALLHILVKPTRPDLRTNLVVNTDRRTYHLELTASPETWMASVSWDYPQDRLLALQGSPRAEAAPVTDGVAVERLRFRYAISGDSPPWRPVSVFDDQAKVYIQFPAGIAQGELPPIFVVGPTGENQLVNARFRAPYYIVDRLFGAAELRLGGERQQVVRIERTDGRRRGGFFGS